MSAVSQNQIYKRLGVSPEQLRLFCEQLPIAELALFGSVLREDFREDSDIDLLVCLSPGHSLSLIDFIEIEDQFKKLFQRDVDLIERDTVQADANWIRRQAILSQAQVIYGAESVLSA